LVYDNKLFCNHQRGVTIFDKNNNQYTIKLPKPCWGMVVYEKIDKHVFVSSNTETYVLEKVDSKWQFKSKLKGHHSFEKGLGFDYNNYLWTYVQHQGLARLKLNRQLDSVIEVKIFTTINNEKLNENVDLYIVDQQVFVLLSNNIYAYNSFNNAFVKVDFKCNGEIVNIIEWNEQETVWLNTSEGIIKFKKNQDAKYYPFNEEYYNFKYFSKTEKIKSIGSDDIIFMHPKGISYYHNERVKGRRFKMNSRIRKVNLINNDSIVFGGTFPVNADVFSNIQQNENITISYSNNSLRFSFGTVIPQVSSEIKYQCKLEKFDKKWSKWTNESTKDYTNLRAGKYTFMVKAKSATQKTGEIAKYSFEVLPPWYFTNQAYVAYFLVLFILIIIIYQFINIRVRRKVEKVEKDIKIDLFTDISHEIKTPITLILSPLEEIIAKGKDSEENNSLHMLMYRNAKKLKYLVNLLLDLRKVETGSMHLQVKNNDIVQFVEDIYIPFNYIAKQHKIEYKFNANYKTLDFCFDPQKLEIILTNLLSNAFKYTNKEGKISVAIGEINKQLKPNLLNEFENEKPNLKIGKLQGVGFIEIAIEDSGIGISKDAMTKIFKKFYHDSNKNYLNTKSTGIGLAFAEKLIQLHRGEICVWSRANYGSKFLIRLSADENYYSKEEVAEDSGTVFKIEKEEEIQAETQKTEGIEKNTHKVNLLVIDDEKDMRVYLRKLFENDYQVIEAENGAEGLKIIQQELPDIIISDIKMPEMTGIELCRKVKNDAFTAHIPVVLLTGTSNEEVQFKGFESGANQYIPKPFNPNLLKVRVQNLLENNSKIKQQINTDYFDDISNLVKDIPEEKNLLAKATEIINDNLSNPDFNINTLASELSLSRTILYRKLKEYTDITPNEYIQVIRLKKSKRLLCRKDLTISEVAYMVGYNDAKYFSTSFKKYFSSTPKEYREKV